MGERFRSGKIKNALPFLLDNLRAMVASGWFWRIAACFGMLCSSDALYPMVFVTDVDGWFVTCPRSSLISVGVGCSPCMVIKAA